MEYRIYTDGACSGNPGPGGFAYVITAQGRGSIKRAHGGYRLTTNNRMEILAAAEALEAVITMMTYGDNDVRDLTSATVVSDSALVVGTMTQNWKRKSNNDLWKRLCDARDALRNIDVDVTFEKVKGHAGNEWNVLADRLAVAAATVDIGSMDEDTGYTGKPSPATNAGPDLSPDDIRLWLASAAQDTTGSAYHLLASMFASHELSLERLAAELSRHLA